MTDDKQQLKVVFDGQGDLELEAELEELLAKHGYRRWASGYDLVDHQRDLAFQRPWPRDSECPSPS